MKKAGKYIKRLLIWGFVLFLLLVAGAWGLSRLYEDEVKAYVIEQINQRFSARIDVEKIDLNFLQKFPNASLRFKNIQVKDNHIPENPPVLIAKKLFLQFNIRDLLQKKFILKKVSVEEGKIDLLRYETGQHNYNLFSEQSKDSASSFFFSIQQFRLKEMDFVYENQGNKLFVELHMSDLQLPFSLSDSLLETGIEGKASLENLKNEGVELLRNIPMEINTALKYSIQKQELRFAPSSLLASGIPLELKGFFDLAQAFMQVDVEALPMDAKKIMAYLPEITSAAFQIKDAGKIKAAFHIEGNLGGKKLPAYSGDVFLENALVHLHQGDFALNINSLQAQINSGQGPEQTQIRISNFKGLLNQKKLEGNLSLSNLQDPKLRFALESSLDLSKIKKVFKVDFFSQMQGLLGFKLQFTGKPHELYTTQSFLKSNLKARFSLKDGLLQIDGQQHQYEAIEASGSLTPDVIQLDQVSLKTDATQLTAFGRVYNYLALSGVETPGILELNLSAQGNQLSLNQLLATLSVKDEGKTEQKSLEWIGQIDFKLAKFMYENITLNQCSGIITYYQDAWKINQLKSHLASGSIYGNLQSKPGLNQNTLYSFMGDFANIDISALFALFNNFDQDLITSKNISGKSSGKLVLDLAVNAKGELVYPSLSAECDLTIIQGKLSGVEQLNSLSAYTRIDDFSEINFSTLSNHISILGEQISVPKMHIESDKMNLDLYGTHSFQNQYDYHLDILLSEILNQKYQKPKDQEFGIVENDGTGQTRLFLRILGQGSDFTVKYDRQEAGKKLKQDLQQEKDEVKQVLKDEFINPKRDSLRKARKSQKKEELEKLKKQESGEFIIEWDEGDF